MQQPAKFSKSSLVHFPAGASILSPAVSAFNETIDQNFFDIQINHFSSFLFTLHEFGTTAHCFSPSPRAGTFNLVAGPRRLLGIKKTL